MAGISKTELSARRQRLLDELPLHGWDYAKAGIAAGYSPAYAQTHLKTHVTKDVSFCQAVSAKRAEIEAGTQDKRERCLKVLDSIIEDEKAAARDRIRATEVRGKMCGWLSERIQLEVPDRQRELAASEQRVAQHLAGLMHQTASLPGEAPIMPFLTPPRPRIIDAEFTRGEGEDADGPEAERDDGPDKDM